MALNRLVGHSAEGKSFFLALHLLNVGYRCIYPLISRDIVHTADFALSSPARVRRPAGQRLCAAFFIGAGLCSRFSKLVSLGRIFSPAPLTRKFSQQVWASITASATFGHSASPDSVTCWHIMDCNEPCRFVSSILTIFVIATHCIPSTYRHI